MGLLHRDTALKISLSSKSRIKYCFLFHIYFNLLDARLFCPFSTFICLKVFFTILMKWVLFFHVYLYHAETKDSWSGHTLLSSVNPVELHQR